MCVQCVYSVCTVCVQCVYSVFTVTYIQILACFLRGGCFKGTRAGAAGPSGPMCDLICVTASCEDSSPMMLQPTHQSVLCCRSSSQSSFRLRAVTTQHDALAENKIHEACEQSLSKN